MEIQNSITDNDYITPVDPPNYSVDSPILSQERDTDNQGKSKNP